MDPLTREHALALDAAEEGAKLTAEAGIGAIRGKSVALTELIVALIERAAVTPDFRGPDSIRLGVAPLYTGHADVWDALDRLRGLVEREEHHLVDTAPGRVT
jgi:kynureninase